MLLLSCVEQRKKPSVAAMIFPFSGNHYLKFYWGTEETLIPVYQTIEVGQPQHTFLASMRAPCISWNRH